MRMSRRQIFRSLYFRSFFFICVYLFIYVAPIIVIYLLPQHWWRHVPGRIINYVFFFPQWSFPFGALTYGYTPGSDTNAEALIFDGLSAFSATVLYLMLLGFAFSLFTRSVERFRWIVPLAFCSSIVSVFFLNVAFWVCGVTVALDGP